MKLRFLAILILLLPSAYSIGMVAGHSAHENPTSGCCAVEEAAPCCDTTEAEELSVFTANRCGCSVSPADPPLPTSLPMMPLAMSGVVFSIAQPKELIFELAVEAPTAFGGLGFEIGAIAPSSNTHAQALLGVWRI